MNIDTPTSQDKQVTIPVPEDRLPEFYAFYARFLAGDRPGGRRGRRRGPSGHGPGHGHGHGHGCRKHRDEQTEGHPAATSDAPAAPATPQQDPAA